MHAESTRSPAPDTRTLGELVSVLARRTPDGLLVSCAGAGVIGVATIGIFLRGMWWLTPFFLMLAAFGTWGIADRERAALGAQANGFRVLRIVAGIVGAAAAAATAVMLFMLVIGPLIS